MPRLIKATVTVNNSDDGYHREFHVEFDPQTGRTKTDVLVPADLEMAQGLAALMRERYGEKDKDDRTSRRRGGPQGGRRSRVRDRDLHQEDRRDTSGDDLS